ncbi:alpha-2 adrenergic receptor-like isoform X1 [Oppia nitens]|uniref:alpha-2 adrenergic receptor-like isoform X1 n=1 Tax=Oppia nitens TaxID=1686743 RepID=UPI0023DB621F|nr:alpha-2 adrenergic receptor-like isoform X1 [Oppia nitens]
MPYPSGYTQLAIVLLAFFITCIMILIVVGNMLVCIAIATEKSLKPVQNWFIASLAVSDFLLGLVIMPFSLARELMGYWMFGKVWCDIWLALDVLLCTASINNLFMISLDRYWSITQAVKYLKKRTPSRAALMIAFVWMLSAVVSLPPLVGWKKPDMMVSQEFPQCNVSEDVGYVMYSSIGSFYFPALMMVFVYARIFHAARARARRHVQQKRLQIQQEVTADPIKEKSTTTTTCGDDGVAGYKPYTPESSPLPISFTTGSQPHTGGPQIQRTTPPMGTPTTVSPPQIVVEAIPDSQSSTPQKDISIIYNNYESITPTPVDAIVDNNDCDVRFKCLKQTKCSPGVQTKRKPPKLTIVLPESTVPPKGLTKQNGSAIRTTETRFISTDDDSDAAESPLSRDTITHESKTFLSAPKLLKSQTYGSTLSIADYDESDMCMDNDIENSDDNVKSKKSSIKGGGRSVQCRNQTTGGLRSTTSDAERHKRKIAKARERRATLILGLIMAAFITAWLPFFVLYMLAALCQDCKDAIPSAYFSVAFWLGYCNSAANPIIYTIFNRDFRRAFRKILFK